jgi:hypothetical protein
MGGVIAAGAANLAMGAKVANAIVILSFRSIL